MDRLQRRNPSRQARSSSLKPPRPPRGPNFQPPPASRPLPEPSSPDGRKKKKIRFANEDGNHHIAGRHIANIREAAKVSDAKTAEYKFFKKLCEQSGHSSHSCKHSHLSTRLKIPKRKHELHNVTPLRKFSVQGNTVYCDESPATPSKNEQIADKQVNVQSPHSECEGAPQLNPHDYVSSTHVFTPIAQTSFEVSEISRNIDREPASGRIFSEKRSKLLKMAAKTVSMGTAELLARRSDYVGGILKRLGANNVVRKKQHEGSMVHRKIDHIQAPATFKGYVNDLLDYRQCDFNSSARLRRPGNEAYESMALPWAYNHDLPSFIDWKNGLPHGGNEARECLALPWMCIKDISSSDQNGGIVHNQVTNLLPGHVEPDIFGRSASANELSLSVQTAPYDQHGWSPMLSVALDESFRDKFSFPCRIEEQHTVPYAISNTSWQPDPCSSIEQCISSSVGLHRVDPKEAGRCDNSDAGSIRLNQLLAKSTASRFLDTGNEIPDENNCGYISNFHVSQSNNMVLSANTSYPSSTCSTLVHPYELDPVSLHDSAVGISCLAGLEEKYSTEVELSDNSERLLQVLDQLPLKFTPPSFSEDSSGILDHLRYITSWPPKDSSNTLCLHANDTGLDSLPLYSEHTFKQDWNSLHDSSTESWSSVHQLQSHGSLGGVFGFMSNESAYSDLEGHHSLMVVQGSLSNEILCTTDLSVFGPCSAMDSIKEAPFLSCDGITW